MLSILSTGVFYLRKLGYGAHRFLPCYSVGSFVCLPYALCSPLAPALLNKSYELDPLPGLFDHALRASLEKIVTASGPGFSDWQWRHATLPIKLGGLCILSTEDISQYVFLASRLQTSALQAKILMKTGIESQESKVGIMDDRRLQLLPLREER
ncbi:hypothetical protein Tco_0513908 [Tanacetum coccineum]